MKQTTRLQDLFHRGEVFIIPGGACALHARIYEAAGYDCAYMSGAQTSAHILGIPDAGLITMTEMVENAGRMAAAVDIPVISDADQGFGNAINCLLYTSDAADEEDSVDLGGRRIIKKKKQ